MHILAPLHNTGICFDGFKRPVSPSTIPTGEQEPVPKQLDRGAHGQLKLFPEHVCTADPVTEHIPLTSFPILHLHSTDGSPTRPGGHTHLPRL